MSSLPIRERVPDRYCRHPQTAAILEALEKQSSISAAQIDHLLKQFFVETATWSLYLWERKYGIAVDESKPLADRRAAVRDKMTAAGNPPAEMVRQLAMALTGYEARVVVHSADYAFSLEFLGKGNTLADIDVSQVRKMVEQIKPAHLQFIISGLTWNDIESVGLTWQWFDDTPASWAEFESKFCVHKKAQVEKSPVFLQLTVWYW